MKKITFYSHFSRYLILFFSELFLISCGSEEYKKYDGYCKVHRDCVNKINVKCNNPNQYTIFPDTFSSPSGYYGEPSSGYYEDSFSFTHIKGYYFICN